MGLLVRLRGYLECKCACGTIVRGTHFAVRQRVQERFAVRARGHGVQDLAAQLAQIREPLAQVCR